MMLVGPAEIKPRESVGAASGGGDAARRVGRLKLNRLPPVHGDISACLNGVVLDGVLLPCSFFDADDDDS